MRDFALARLIVAGDRSARRRLLGIVAGVMVGVAVFLLLTAAYQAFGERSRRSSWHTPITASPTALMPDTELTAHTAGAASTLDHVGNRTVTVLLVATTEDTRVRIPGSDVVPRPGQYLASPAMADLIASMPADQLAERYGRQVGVLSEDAVEGPDSLVLVVGMEAPRLAAWQGSEQPQVVTGFVGHDYAAQAYRIVAAVGALAILAPVLLLIAIVTDLGAAQRAERFATLRLIGATPGRVARLAAAETAATSALGAVAGIVLYLALIPAAARLTIGSSRFFARDLLTSPLVMILTTVGVVGGATAVSWWRTRRASIGPLGASRERRERAPRPVRLLPLLLGLAGLTAVRLAGGRLSTTALVTLLIGSFLSTMLGLLWAGPLLTCWAARAARRRARTAAQVMGLGRLVQHPRAAFRAVGGMVVALYAVTLFAVAITAAAGVPGVRTGPGRLSPQALFTTPATADPAALDSVLGRLRAVPGVTTASLGYPQAPQQGQKGRGLRLVLPVEDVRALGEAGADSPTGWVSVDWGWVLGERADPAPAQAPQTDGPSSGSPSAASAPVLLVATDGGPGAVERARTAMVSAVGADLVSYPVSRYDIRAVQASATENQFAALGYIGILIAAGVSTASLAVSTVSSLLARRRVLGLLRLTGMPHAALRRVVAYETLLPAATVLALSIGAAAYTAWVLITGVSARSISWPAGSYYAVVGACLALVGVAVLASARAATRMVSGTAVRFE
ncbi:ABC transporter permease [Actinomyces sp. oral taxon 414]|uniref:FtsX-like permease family protein n=1 Tax=Actinomyces sp. oral taxon 414 TaxID=712122 RepID=UPI0006AFA3D2|nr:FtsX-like permease family protein [Actinomyces sp. oral taxon 414]ALC98456.1 ABC transporter permease [Actinomyces sp. oral taxon 414]